MDAVATSTSEHLPSYANVTWRRRFLRDGLLHPIAFNVLVKLRHLGTENIPAVGPVILLMNHIAFIDPVVTGVALKQRWVTPLAKKEVMRYPILNGLIKMWGVVPVDRFQMDRKALQQTLALLEAEHCVLIAPEGTRHPEMQALKEGFVFLATKANAIIVPAALEGTDRFGRRPRDPGPHGHRSRLSNRPIACPPPPWYLWKS
jgi:1-acyl-sn-glycerol-3-phosphate acyltransferase